MSNKNITDGFEEFAQSINELSPAQKEKLKNESDSFQSFELYSFLEEEVKRLDKLSSTLDKTAYKLEQYSQEDNVYKLKQEENESQVDAFLAALSHKKNNFWRSINETFNDSF